MRDLTVVIRVKNEERWIGHAIQSVVNHAPEAKILVIDNHSTDYSIKIANLFKHDTSVEKSSQYLDLKILSIDNYSPGRALNLAAQNVATKYMLVLSSHCEIVSLPYEPISRLESDYSALFGKQIPRYYGKNISPRYIWSNYHDQSCVNMFSSLENRYFFHNAFSAFNTSFLRSNPFDESLVGKEDRYWANSIISNGSQILYDPSLVCYHHFTVGGNTWRGID